MNRRNTNVGRGKLVLIACAAALTARPATAAIVYVNSADVLFANPSTVAQAKYRLSQTNFDQSLDNGAGTSNTSNFISAHLGNGGTGAGSIRGVTFDFSLQHLVGDGFIYRMRNTATGSTSVLRWGEFATNEGTTALTLGGLTPDREFNSLYLETRATQTSVNPSFSVSGLTFTSDSLSSVGSFFDRVVTPTYSEPGSSSGFSFQRLVSDVNLAEHAFTVSGQLMADRLSGNGSDEQLKFTVYAQRGTASLPVAPPGSPAVPEPAAAIALPAALLLLRRRVRA